MLAVLTTALSVGAMVLFVPFASGVSSAVLSGSPSSFESADQPSANMVVDTAGEADWNCFTSWPTTGNGAINVGASCSTKINKANYFQEASNPAHVDSTAGGQSDVTWKPGQKMDVACPSLVPDPTTGKGTGGAPAKDTIYNLAQYFETAINNGVLGDTFLYGATVRHTANGTANENVELNQLAPTSSCAINRSQGDKLIAIDYTGGGSTVGFHVYTWVENSTGSGFTDAAGDPISGTCNVGNSSSVTGCWSSTIKDITGTSYANGNVNGDAAGISATDNGISNEALLTNTFAEFGVDLAGAGILPSGSCQGFADTVYETRSSSSFSSNPEDIETVNKPISNCGTINVIKVTDPAAVDKAFQFTSNLNPNTQAGGVGTSPCSAAGVANDGHGTFCLNAGKSSTGGNEVSESTLPPGSYSITEGTEPAGWTLKEVKCVSSVTGSSNSFDHTTSPVSATASLTLAAGETITCTYTDHEQFGAIKIIKTSTKNSSTRLDGATFTITQPDGTLLSRNSSTTFTTANNGTGNDGTICVDNLTQTGSYTITETNPPSTSYGLASPASQTYTFSDVGPNGCTSTSFPAGSTFTFQDPPLTKITVTAQSQVASPNNTSSKVYSCTDTSTGTSGTWTNSGSSFTDPASASRTGYLPTGSGTFTVTCTVQIDP